MRLFRQKFHLFPLLGALGFVLLAGCSSKVNEIRYVVRNADLGTALVAKDLCYGLFLQGRDEADVRGAELGPFLDPRLSWTRARIDHDRREVKTHLVGLFRSRAVQLADGSCVLGSEAHEGARRPPLTPNPDPWPEGDAIHPETEGFIPDLVALEAAVAREFEPTASGVDRGTRSVLVIHRGRLVYERHAPGWDRHVPQNGRSMSKVMAAVLSGKLAHEGMLHLDDASLHPDWTDDRSRISLRHLLTMTSGLEWDEANGPGDSAEATLNVERAFEFAAGKPPLHVPGERFHYSGGDTELVMGIVETRSTAPGSARDSHSPETLFRWLGIRSAVLDRDRSGNFLAMTGMHASAVDWARLGLFLARDGVWEGERLLPEGWVDFMRTPTAESKCNYGAMVWVRGGCTDGTPSPVFELSGFMGQGVTIVPETETIIVRTGFGPWIMGDLLDRIFDSLGVEAPTRMAMEID